MKGNGNVMPSVHLQGVLLNKILELHVYLFSGFNIHWRSQREHNIPTKKALSFDLPTGFFWGNISIVIYLLWQSTKMIITECIPNLPGVCINVSCTEWKSTEKHSNEKYLNASTDNVITKITRMPIATIEVGLEPSGLAILDHVDKVCVRRCYQISKWYESKLVSTEPWWHPWSDYSKYP